MKNQAHCRWMHDKKKRLYIFLFYIQEFTTGDLWNTTLIPAVCIWFISNTPQYNFGTHYLLSSIEIELEICVPQTGKRFPLFSLELFE